MTLDTTAILHLFVDDVSAFKTWYKEHFGVDLIGLDNKDALAASFKKLVGRETTSAEDAQHAMRCWEYVGMPANMDSGNTRIVRKRMKRNLASACSEGSAVTKTRKTKKQAIAAKAFRNPDDYEAMDLRFQRMVMTDGYNLSVLMTTADDVRGKVLGARRLANVGS